MRYVAGIDGGGTKTTLICADLNFKEIFKKTYGAFNINSIGQEAFEQLLDEIIKDLKELGECLALCIGAAGCSNAIMAETVKRKFKKADISYSLVGDHIIALEGAHDGKAGFAIIAGTGAICFGKGEDGTLVRAGGWGHLIGDEGSAYGLARDMIKAVAAYIDGYGQETVLTRLLSEKVGLTSSSQIIQFVYSGDKAKLASISYLVDEACKEGDVVALKVVEENAYALARDLASVAKKLSLEEGYVAFFGGLIDKPTPFREELIKQIEKLTPKIKVRASLNTAAWGAVALAMKQYNRGMEND